MLLAFHDQLCLVILYIRIGYAVISLPCVVKQITSTADAFTIEHWTAMITRLCTPARLHFNLYERIERVLSLLQREFRLDHQRSENYY